MGRLILVDGDVVEETNLNRQLVALHSTLGRSKVEVAAQRVLDIAPGCRAEAHAMFYLPEQGQGLIDGCDYVADCIDMVVCQAGAGRGVPGQRHSPDQRHGLRQPAGPHPVPGDGYL